MIYELVKAFVIGSSSPVFLVFLWAVQKYEKKHKIRFSYYNYSLLAPLYLGGMTVLSKLIQIIFKINLRLSLFITSIISIITIIIIITSMNLYRFHSNSEWISQYFKMGITHLITYNIVIYSLFKLFNK